jgi:hypothetical protein
MHATNKTSKNIIKENLQSNLEPSLSQKLNIVSPQTISEDNQQTNLKNTNIFNNKEKHLNSVFKDNPFFKLAEENFSNYNSEELSFKIQLTENEYKLLVLEKANKIKLK